MREVRATRGRHSRHPHCRTNSDAFHPQLAVGKRLVPADLIEGSTLGRAGIWKPCTAGHGEYAPDFGDPLKVVGSTRRTGSADEANGSAGASAEPARGEADQDSEPVFHSPVSFASHSMRRVR